MRRRPIQVDADTWIVMRESEARPKAVIRRITSTQGEPRFLVMTWEPIPADQRLVSMHATLSEADEAVPVQRPGDHAPPGPGLQPEVYERYEARKKQSRAKQARQDGDRSIPVENVPPSEAWR